MGNKKRSLLGTQHIDLTLTKEVIAALVEIRETSDQGESTSRFVDNWLREHPQVREKLEAQQKVITTLREHPDWCVFYQPEGAFYQQPDGTRIHQHRAAIWVLMQNGGLVQEDEEQHTWTLAPHLQEKGKPS